MKALVYLTWRSFVNNIKRAVKKPVTLILMIFMAAYMVYVALLLGKLVIDLRFDSVQGLVVLISIWTIYVFLTNFIGYASKKGVLFRPGHTHFVFPAPIGPKLILVYSAWMNYLLSVAVNLLFVVAGLTVFGVEPWRMFLFFVVGSILELLLEGSLMVFLYTNESLPEGVLKGLCNAIKAFLVAVTLFFVWYFYRKGFTLESFSTFFDWNGLQMVPVVGWNIAAYRLILSGPTQLNVICTVLYVLTVAAMFFVAWRMKCEGGYFEDAAKFADDYVQMRKRKNSGELVTSIGEKKKKFRRISGDYQASGAKAIFYRQLLEYKKERYFIFSKVTLINLIVSLLLAFAFRENATESGAPQMFLLGIIAYMTLVLAGVTGKWESELKSPYLFLIPDTPVKKLWYATLMEHVKALADGILFCIPIGIMWSISPILIVQAVLIYMVLQANKMYTKVIVQCLMGDLLGKTVQELVRVFIQMFIIGIGVLAAVLAGVLLNLNLVFPIVLIYSMILTMLMGALASIRFDSMEQMD